MFRFEQPVFFYLLLALPLLVLLFVSIQRRKRAQLSALGSAEVVPALLRYYTPFKPVLKFAIWLFALLLLVVALANPQMGTKKQRVTRKAVDIFICLDVSRSMLAQDVLPSRLSLAKQFIGRLVEQLKGNRVGTIMFAGNAYLQMPLTTDYGAAHVFVQTAECDMLPTQGTAIAEAVALAVESFPKAHQNHSIIVLFSDGEDHDANALAAVKRAAEEGIVVFTVGVGTPAGSPIPEHSDDGITKLKLDASGATIHSKLNESLLKGLAEAGGGAYFALASNPDVFGALHKTVNQLEKREFETRMFSAYDSYYQYFVLGALFLLLLESAVSYRNTVRWSISRLFD